ncbi:helix-turn-helix domain-containing protein [Cryobacterium luteum]|uniref:DNA-binding protein n=1 Tax=Cryobacterium luteum TaxID=1424661 RepID=A0A1H8M563_9MICO|nr:helix-turn-helix domain-containing protein [Cryobacterium luteum]TFB90091.1 DNA-binding protein [Cryobacterium luteum]SEO12469.1 Helix-turn-helix domain-containing protein [Cryobacterium luteum]
MLYSSASLIDFLDLPAASERSNYGVSTIRRHIKAGLIPAVKIKGRVYVKPEDLDAFVAPAPIVVADTTLKDWAARMAAKAPAFRPEQRDVIVSAFTSSLRGE